jgi:hypothetical protein
LLGAPNCELCLGKVLHVRPVLAAARGELIRLEVR